MADTTRMGPADEAFNRGELRTSTSTATTSRSTGCLAWEKPLSFLQQVGAMPAPAAASA